MKVRLKPDPKKRAYRDMKFQFHEGPIKTQPTKMKSKIITMFQFHEGPIKTEKACFSIIRNTVSIP